ncbi:MAG TPA: prenyltransferase/squalene oxidase repeat-containing protein [Actinomycetes bacterium]
MSRAPLPSRRHRLLAALSLLLVPAVLLATPGLAEAAPTRDRADAGAGWLGRQLDDESHVVVGQFGPAYGQTADLVLALSAAGVGKGKTAAATRALKAHVVDYTGGGDTDEYYAGSFAKLLVVAAARRTDPRAFGSSERSDLVAELRGLECGPRRTDCAAADRGRFSDISQFGDFSNGITQSLALLGLARTTRTGPSVASVGFLLDQQCDNGAFPESFGTTTCTGSVDATGYAVQALTTVGTPAASAAAADAGRWLARRQHDNGSFTGNETRNANSTALAAQAFDALDRPTRARQARAFLRSLQATCGAKPALRGSLRHSRAEAGDRILATTQAVPALARVTLGEVTSAGSVRGLPRLAC